MPPTRHRATDDEQPSEFVCEIVAQLRCRNLGEELLAAWSGVGGQSPDAGVAEAQCVEDVISAAESCGGANAMP